MLYGGEGWHDTWEWDGTNWAKKAIGTSPRIHTHRLVYDTARERCVLVGTNRSVSAEVAMEAWEWDGANWLRRSVAEHPKQRAQFDLCYDMALARTLMFGSWITMNDTWEYGPTHGARLTTYGAGCAGSAGIPTLTAPRPPWLGEFFTIRLGSLPAGPAVVMLGDSSSAWGGVPLPLRLDPLGMTGCSLLANPLLLLPVLQSSGSGTASFVTPGNAALLGGSFYTQAFVVDPQANLFGATVSNAGAGRIGGR